MCFDFDSRPPELPAGLGAPPMAGGAPAELLTLSAADGNRFSAALAEAPQPRGGANVIVLPDVRGLYPFYIELAERFAQAGHHAIALDWFGRSAGLGPRGEDFEWREHIEAVRPEDVEADARACREVLAERAGAGPVVTVGFCFGGSYSLYLATSGPLALTGVVGFYGGLSGRMGRPRPAEHADRVRCPVLGLFGGADPSIPPEEIEEYEQALTAAGAEHEIVVYPGAPHSFFDRAQPQFADASEDAWRRTLAFLV